MLQGHWVKIVHWQLKVRGTDKSILSGSCTFGSVASSTLTLSLSHTGLLSNCSLNVCYHLHVYLLINVSVNFESIDSWNVFGACIWIKTQTHLVGFAFPFGSKVLWCMRKLIFLVYWNFRLSSATNYPVLFKVFGCHVTDPLFLWWDLEQWLSFCRPLQSL